MSSPAGQERVHLPRANAGFFDTFMPFEIRLAQRRAMIWGSGVDDVMHAFIGLYLVRLTRQTDGGFPGAAEGGTELGDHVYDLLRNALRDSDIAGSLSPDSHLGVARDVYPERANVIAQRFLTAAASSALVSGADLVVRLGYVIYPLSTPPDHPVDQWHTLLALAHQLSCRDASSNPVSGIGMLRGVKTAAVGIPETDLIPLALQDPEALVRAGVLQLQRINLLPRM